MHCLPRRILPIVLAIVALLLTACQVPLPYLPVLPADAEVVSAQDGAVAATPEAKEAPADEPSEEETKEETDAAASDVADADTTGTETDGAEVDIAEVDIKETATPEEPIMEEAEQAEPMATIVVRSLRIRSGPGIEHGIIGGANQGEAFPIVGQAFDCQWLQVEHPTLGIVWLSGLPQYTAVDTDCAQLAESDGSSPVVATPTPAPAVEEPAGADAAVEPTSTPEPQQESAEAPADTLPADQGCYLIQNQLGPELNVTITAQDREWSDNFQIGEGQEAPYCLMPGRYTVTVDAPPPWADLNDQLTVQPGDRYFWPIRAGE